jgi:SAM-dependent methyltransferase
MNSGLNRRTRAEASLHSSRTEKFQSSRVLLRVKDRIAPICSRSWLALSKSNYADLDFSLFDLATIGDRWIRGLFWGYLNGVRWPSSIHDVLVVGCGSGSGTDVSIWLDHGIPRVDGCDIQEIPAWQDTAAKYNSEKSQKIRFFQSPLESLSALDESYDIVYSQAVLEHVADLKKSIEETHRVLRVGGISCHMIGPLYCAPGGDHCISDYGLEHSYDHLLADQESYLARVKNDQFYATTDDPNKAWWAKNGIFSFAKPHLYLKDFRSTFSSVYSIAILSPDAPIFRKKFPEKWNELLNNGYTPTDLSIKGLAIVARK